MAQPPPTDETPAARPGDDGRAASNRPPAMAEGGLAADLVSGASIGTVMVIREISLAALVFSGALAPYVSVGVGLALASALVVRLLVAIRSSYGGTQASLQDAPIAVLAVAAAAIVARSGGAASDQTFLTVVAFGVAATVLCGLCFLVLGTFRLAHLVRFVPYPVIGGFLAGTGWLIAKGSVGVMSGTALHWDTLGVLVEPGAAARLASGLGIAVLLLVLTRVRRHFLIIPGVFATGVAVFYVVLGIAGVSAGQARGGGWLFGPFPEGGLWGPYVLDAVRTADWGAMLGQAGTVGSILLVSLLALLLNASGLEIAIRRDVDLNRELRVAGLANLGAALVGGMIGYQSCSLSVLASEMGGRGRRVGFVAAALTAVVLFTGPTFLAYLPKPVLGGVLLYLGASIMIRWLYVARSGLPRSDYLVLVLIVVAIGTLGFLQGVGLGILAAILLFVVRTSLVGVVKRECTGASCRSNVDRPNEHRRELDRAGDHVYVLQLNGYLFFGTADRLLQQVRGRATDPAKPPLWYLILDFGRVAGIDSSAVFSFVRMQQLAESRSFVMVLAHLSDTIRSQMEKGGVREQPGAATAKPIPGEAKPGGVLRVFRDLDHGIEWVENRILERTGQSGAAESASLRETLDRLFEGKVNLDSLMNYLEREEVPAGGYLVKQGDPPDGMIFIESGRVTVELALDGGKSVRLRTMQKGTIVGEVGWYMDQPRSASVLADSPTVIHRLSSAAVEEMSRKDPASALAFHACMARLLAERLVQANRSVEALSE